MALLSFLEDRGKTVKKRCNGMLEVIDLKKALEELKQLTDVH